VPVLFEIPSFKVLKRLVQKARWKYEEIKKAEEAEYKALMG
jgi:hypothetical protein